MTSIASSHLNDPPNLLVINEVAEAHCDFDVSRTRILKALFDSEATHFWFGSRNRFIVDRLSMLGVTPPSTMLEVGCGSGTVLKHLRNCGYAADGLDMHLKLARLAADNCPQARIYCQDIMDADLEVFDKPYDVIGLFDVLEHLDDPVQLLRRCAQLGDTNTIIIGTVPALKLLWSYMDESGGHKRRYNRRLMSEQLKQAGLKILRLEYFFHSLIVPMWLKRRWTTHKTAGGPLREIKEAEENLAPPPKYLNGALAAVCGCERALSHWLPVGRLPGASLLFAAQPITDPQ